MRLRSDMTSEECMRMIVRMAPASTLSPQEAARLLADMLPAKK
jgi:hypothetical protein